MDLSCLIVDDSAAFLRAARGLLEREGIRVVGVASSGAQALEQAQRLYPDVLLLDIDLGGESGLELAHRLAAEPALAASRMILISTHAGEDFAELIEASPAVGFLPKAELSARAIAELLGQGAAGQPGDGTGGRPDQPGQPSSGPDGPTGPGGR
jgi:CheY-like chemotaxis protein